MFDVVTRHLRDLVHHFKHSWHDLLQEILFFFFFWAVRGVLQPGSYKPEGKTWPDSRPNSWMNNHGSLELSRLGSRMKLSKAAIVDEHREYTERQGYCALWFRLPAVWGSRPTRSMCLPTKHPGHH